MKLPELPVDFLIYDIMYLLSLQEAPKSFKEPPGMYKKIQGSNPYNIFVAILVEPMRHFEIN